MDGSWRRNRDCLLPSSSFCKRLFNFLHLYIAAVSRFEIWMQNEFRLSGASDLPAVVYNWRCSNHGKVCQGGVSKRFDRPRSRCQTFVWTRYNEDTYPGFHFPLHSPFTNKKAYYSANQRLKFKLRHSLYSLAITIEMIASFNQKKVFIDASSYKTDIL